MQTEQSQFYRLDWLSRTFASAVAVSGPDASRVEDLVYAQVVEVDGQIELAAAAVRVTGAPSVSFAAVVMSLLLQHQHGTKVTLHPDSSYNE